MFRKFRAKRATDFEPSTEIFPSIATSPIAGKLKLEKRGRTDGEADYPASETTSMTTAEQEAISEITRLRKRGIDAFDTHFNAYQARIDLSQSAVSQIDVQAGNLRNDMVSESDIQQNKVMNALLAVRERNSRLEDYRGRHGLTGPPREPKNGLVAAALIFFLFVAEVLLGAFFFGDLSPTGLVGGLTKAVMISIVNVGIGALLGFFSRYVTLRGVIHRIGGGLCLALFLPCAFAFNLFVAHYRKAIEEMPWDQAAGAMWDSLITSPFDIGNFNAILIALFGFGVALFAFIKIWGLKDPHPGFSDIYDDTRDAIEDYAEAYEGAHKRLNDLFEKSRDTLLAEAHTLRGTVRGSANAHAGQTTLCANLDAFLEECGQVANALLRSYREANERARSTPPPGHFSVAFKFPRHPGRHVSEFAADRIDREIARVNEAAARGVQDILEAREKQLKALPKTDALLDSISKGDLPDVGPVASLELVKGGRR